jgi:hypothetical protein
MKETGREYERKKRRKQTCGRDKCSNINERDEGRAIEIMI